LIFIFIPGEPPLILCSALPSFALLCLRFQFATLNFSRCLSFVVIAVFIAVAGAASLTRFFSSLFFFFFGRPEMRDCTPLPSFKEPPSSLARRSKHGECLSPKKKKREEENKSQRKETLESHGWGAETKQQWP